jgi:hypothetical protein
LVIFFEAADFLAVSVLTPFLNVLSRLY